MKVWQFIMAASTTEVVFWSYMTIDSNGTRRCFFVQDSHVYFILETYIVTIYFWNHKSNHWTDVLTTHALSGSYHGYFWGSVAIWKGNKFQLILYWNETSLCNADWAWCKLKLQCKGDPYNGIQRWLQC